MDQSEMGIEKGPKRIEANHIIWYAHVPLVRSLKHKRDNTVNVSHVKSNRSKIFNDDIFYMQMKFNERHGINVLSYRPISFPLTLSLNSYKESFKLKFMH